MSKPAEAPFIDGESLLDAGLALYDSGGLPKGDATGWKCVDELYTVAPGQWTVITGVPNSGKSEFLDALIVNLWRTRGWEFAIYSPENYPVSTHLAKFVEKQTGKPFGPGPSPRMTRAEFRDTACDLLQDIFWLEPKLKTPDELIRCALNVRTAGKKFGIVLDPWNTLEHQRGPMSETDYVSFILTEVTKLARASNAHVWLVVHPAKMYRDRDGKRAIPTPYDISGSAHWYNKADNILCVHRDQAVHEGVQSSNVEIHVQKVRFKNIGHQGAASLTWDRVTGRYFETQCSADDYRSATDE